ncbi:MAG: AmmeMemoRadiSam system protein B, partial [Victivallales bacterium]|nr:AmmeMemoRadiSam system protein B [Victivallales bacterium]
HEGEHALEVELPILQRMLPEFTLLPLICGELDAPAVRELARELLPYWNEETLWVISSDFTHYGRAFGYMPFTHDIRRHLRELDLGAATCIEKLDPDGFTDYIATTGATICGWNPIRLLLAVIAAAESPVHAELVDYTTSGELTGDFSHCVSYAGFVFTT